MKHIRERKLNNKGVSLVEILVTVVIVALLSSPIINSFLQTMSVNSNARLMQNGTAVAEDTAELFKVFDVDALVETYKKDGVTVTKDNDTGKYTFKDIKMTGADGEEFLVDVELNPSSYKYKSDTGKLEVNDKNLPVFSGLYGSDAVVLYRQYAGPDETLADLFEKQTNLDQSIINNINDEKYRKKIMKSTTINIDCEYNEDTKHYIYMFSVSITYTYNDDSQSETVTVNKVLEKTYKRDNENEVIHNVYMLAPIFDRYSTDRLNNGCFYNTDKIIINYNFESAAEYKHDMYFYIAEQSMNNIGKEGETSIQERIRPENIIINDMPYVEYNNEGNSLKVYTNIGEAYDCVKNINKGYNLTYSDYNTGTALYEMNVTVKKTNNEVVTTFKTTK